MRKILLAAIFSMFVGSAVAAPMEFLQERIGSTVNLEGLFCRNVDKVVRLDLVLLSGTVEKTGFQRLIMTVPMRDDVGYDFLFPKGSYVKTSDGWVVKGYFTVRSGGMHQGVASVWFQPVPPVRADEVVRAIGGCR